MNRFDQIVVGGGTAGCIIAARLAEAGKRVALFEAGPTDEENEKITDLRRWSELLGTELDHDYPIVARPNFNDRIRCSRGKVLGGCGSHNSCIAFETPDYDLRQWGWHPEATRKYFRRIREKVKFESAKLEHPFIDSVFEAANRAGLPTIQFNRGSNDRVGIGWFDLNKKGTKRQSSSVAYLHPLSQWAHRLVFKLKTTVVKILIEGRRAVGVQTDSGEKFYSRSDLVICSGAIDTPKLLLLSGIGPVDHLKEIGIEPVHHLPGVGGHLLDHPEGVLNWQLNRPMPPEYINQWEVGIFEKSSPELPAPDLMMHLGTVNFDMNTKLRGYPTSRYGFSLTPNVTRAKSEGSVRLRSIDPRDPPLIDLNYFSDPQDEKILLWGFKRAREIASQLQDWIEKELTPGETVQSDQEILEYLKSTCNTVYHPAGTCKMGSDPLAVVDFQFRVYGISNLRIADASIFPTMVGVNPNITVMMIGERCADFILHKAKL